MILRCLAPRKHDRLRPCGYWLATVPDSSEVVGIVRSEALARPEEVVVGCGKCGALYAIRSSLTKAA